jgi:hypothetical protein
MSVALGDNLFRRAGMSVLSKWDAKMHAKDIPSAAA